MCGCILGRQSVIYQVLGHCGLDFFFSRIIVSGAYLLYYSMLESQILCIDASLESDMSWAILVTVTLTYDIVSRIIVSGAYSLYYLR